MKRYVVRRAVMCPVTDMMTTIYDYEFDNAEDALTYVKSSIKMFEIAGSNEGIFEIEEIKPRAKDN